jgi:hypothetical protein
MRDRSVAVEIKPPSMSAAGTVAVRITLNLANFTPRFVVLSAAAMLV